MDDYADWEVLHDDSDTPRVGSNSPSDPAAENFGEDELAASSSHSSVIHSDYFSLGSQSKPVLSPPDLTEVGSDDSDSPSWIDPASPVIPCPRQNTWGSSSDSGSDRSDSRKLSDNSESLGCCGPGEVFSIDDQEKNNASVKYGPDYLHYNINESSFTAKHRPGDDATEKFRQETAAAAAGDKKTLSESGGLPVYDCGTEFYGEAKEKADDCSSCAEVGASDGDDEGVNPARINKEMFNGDNVEGTEIRVVWWKVPLDLLKFCVFRVSPVWTVSLAAAVMGFVILGRRLYRIKRKSQGFQLKVTMDHKKVSQFMNRAGRLNEAFSVVRRVPVIRPSLLTAPRSNPWPGMSLR